MSNISYSWPIQLVGNGESLKTVVDKYCKTNTSQKYLLNRIADSPFVYNGTTIISGSLTLDYSRGYWDKHPLYTLISDNIVYTGSLDISKWQVDNIICYAQKSDSGIVNYKDQITSDLINSYVETNFNQASVVTMTNGSKFAIINLTFNLKNSYTANAQIELMTFPKELRPQKNVVFFGYTNRKSSFVYYSVAKNKLMFIPSVNVTPNETELNIGGSYQIS